MVHDSQAIRVLHLGEIYPDKCRADRGDGRPEHQRKLRSGVVLGEKKPKSRRSTRQTDENAPTLLMVVGRTSAEGIEKSQ